MVKQISVFGLIFILCILFCLQFISKAETINQIQTCNGQKCFTNISDAKVADNGELFLIADSAGSPYVRKFGFSSDTITDDTVLPLSESNADQVLFMLGISNDSKKAFAYRVTSASTGSTRVIEQEKEITLYEQTEQGTTCQCPLNTYYNGTLCVAGMLTCTDTTQDTVCGCNNSNYLNSCAAQANGIKLFTKGTCGTMSNLTCSNDSQCPTGTCSGGGTYKQYTCTGGMCALTQFSVEPCLSSSSSSSSSSGACRCSSGTYFDGTKCVSGMLTCSDTTSDPVCSCDSLNFLNVCVAQANGVQRFTKGSCGTTSTLNCNSDDQCPVSTCSNKSTFKQFACSGGMCRLVGYSSDPCTQTTSSGSSGPLGSSGSLIHIIDLTQNSVMIIIPKISLTPSSAGINTVSFLDSEGTQLIASNNDQSAPKLHIINTQSGEITQSITIPDIASSIELSPDFKKAIVTFKDLFAQSIGIYNVSVKKLVKLDIPNDIFFKVDRFLPNVSFDIFGNKCVVSSLGGKHVLYLTDLKNDKLTVRFLSDKFEGKTISKISPDGTVAISVGNISDRDGIVIYKVDASNLRTMRVIKTLKFADKSNVLDVKITPDSNKVLILLSGENEKKIKVLNLRNLSVLCEYAVSSNIKENILVNDPFGRFVLVPDLQSSSVNFIELNSGPVFLSINPLKAPKEGKTEFVISGYIDAERFSGNVKVCFNSEQFCATSVMVSNDRKTITGVTPKFPSRALTSLIILAEQNPSSGAINCSDKFNNVSKYKNVFRFE